MALLLLRSERISSLRCVKRRAYAYNNTQNSADGRSVSNQNNASVTVDSYVLMSRSDSSACVVFRGAPFHVSRDPLAVTNTDGLYRTEASKRPDTVRFHRSQR